MYSKASIAGLFGFAAASSAQAAAPEPRDAQVTGPVVSVLFPGFEHMTERMSVVGSIVTVESSLTTLAVKCAPDTDPNKCGMPSDGMKVTQGPSTLIMGTAVPAWDDSDETDTKFKDIVVSYGWDCKLHPGSASADCNYHVEATTTGTPNPSLLSSYSALMTPMYSTLPVTGKEYVHDMLPVTITAGAEKIVSAAPGGEETGSAQSTGDDTTGAEPAGTGAGSATGTGAGASSPSETPGSAASVKIGGSVIGAAMAAVLML